MYPYQNLNKICIVTKIPINKEETESNRLQCETKISEKSRKMFHSKQYLCVFITWKYHSHYFCDLFRFDDRREEKFKNHLIGSFGSNLFSLCIKIITTFESILTILLYYFSVHKERKVEQMFTRIECIKSKNQISIWINLWNLWRFLNLVWYLVYFADPRF